MSGRLNGALPRISTIDMVHQPLVEYLGRLRESDRRVESISPLDHYLIHLILEFQPRDIMAIDLAGASTLGASTIALMAHPRPSLILVEDAPWPFPNQGRRSLEVLRQFAESMELPGRRALAPLSQSDDPWTGLAASPGAPRLPMALLSASDPALATGSAAADFFDRFPEGFIVALGVGKIGDDPAAKALARMASPETGVHLRLLREGAPSLFESSIAILHRDAAGGAADAVKRIDRLFTTNYDFLSTARNACLYALERGARSQSAGASRSGGPHQNSRNENALEHMTVDSGLDEETLRERNRRLQARVEELEGLLRRELDRSLAKQMMIHPVRKILKLGRRHRAWLAPRNSLRERFARGLLKVYHDGRRLKDSNAAA